MISQLLLLGLCASMPLYGPMDGPACTPERQQVECGCSECLQWDANPVSDNVTNYIVRRIDMDGTTHYIHHMTQLDEVGDPIPPTTIHCPAKHDDSMPRESKTYRYSVSACNVKGCSPYGQEVIEVAAPYAIDFFRPPALNNPR